MWPNSRSGAILRKSQNVPQSAGVGPEPALLEDGMTIEELIEPFPVTREQVKAVREFAARSLDAPVSAS